MFVLLNIFAETNILFQSEFLDEYKVQNSSIDLKLKSCWIKEISY